MRIFFKQKLTKEVLEQAIKKNHIIPIKNNQQFLYNLNKYYYICSN